MIDNSLYNKYKALKEKLNYTYKGYNLQHLIPGYLNYIFAGENPSARDVAKEFYVGLKSIDFRKMFDMDTPVIISYLIERSDYRDLANAAKEQCPRAEVVGLFVLPKVSFSPFRFYYLKHFLKAFGLVFSRSLASGFMTKLYLVALITKLFNQIRLINKVENYSHIKQYVCFNSAYKEESLITEFFNRRNVETISLQHGIFCDFKLLIPFDYINFDNLLAQKVLCWGQSTIDYLKAKGIDRSRLILAGNPKYKDVKIDATRIDRSFTRCLVLLGRGIYTKTNDKLLALLKEYNDKHKDNKILFYLKKHPFLLDSDHKSFASVDNNMIFIGKEHSVQEVLRSDLVNFTISVNTTAYYESLALGKISLRWAEFENEEFFGMDDKFEDLSGFEEKLSLYRQMPAEKIKEEIENVIRYVFNPQL